MIAAMGRRERNNLERRARLLAEGRKLFDAQGVEATTVEQIAAAADVSLRTFYNFFPTKVDLLAAAITGEVRTKMAAMQLALPASTNPRDDILALVRLQFAVIGGLSKAEQKHVASRAILSVGETEAARYSAENDDLIRSQIHARLLDHAERGTLASAIDVDVASSLIFAALNGHYLAWLHSEATLEDEITTVARYLDLILRP